MRMLLIILAIPTLLAYFSQKESMKYKYSDGRYHWDIFLIMLIIFLVFFAGLRTSYNDTGAYIRGFQNSVNIYDFLANSENLDLLHNPLFYGFQALIRTFTDNYTIFFIICAMIVNTLNITFIKRNTETQDFAFSIFLYVTLGTLMISIAAQKQILAMSVLTLALTQLFKKKYARYYLIVFLAGCIHSYAWLFLFLPLLDCKPWSFRTYLLLFATLIVMNTFDETIISLIEVADQIGKNIATEEVFDGNQMNVFRVLVYSVVPITAFAFRSRINYKINRKNQIFIQMCIVSMMFMMMGTMDGANMFGRSANYFEFGLICVLPWLVRKLFTKNSVTIVLSLAMICFTGFYLYDNQGFDNGYHYKEITQFIAEII